MGYYGIYMGSRSPKIIICWKLETKLGCSGQTNDQFPTPKSLDFGHMTDPWWKKSSHRLGDLPQPLHRRFWLVTSKNCGAAAVQLSQSFGKDWLVRFHAGWGLLGWLLLILPDWIIPFPINSNYQQASQQPPFPTFKTSRDGDFPTKSVRYCHLRSELLHPVWHWRLGRMGWRLPMRPFNDGVITWSNKWCYSF